MAKHRIEIEDPQVARTLYGECDGHLRLLRDAFAVSVAAREGAVVIEGDEAGVASAARAFDLMRRRAEEGRRLRLFEVEDIVDAVSRDPGFRDEVRLDVRGGAYVTPRSQGQAAYLDALRHHDIVFAIGPAGTGKTYLAVAMALTALRSGRIKKLILARPAVEAGEKLGFLPGDLEEKVNPYLRPLYDALHDMLDYGLVRKYMERDVIEVVPLAFMRGRTLNHAFVILDEAQNTTVGQMMMFLTRLGTRSQGVITGDVTQVDLPANELSGLVHAQRILSGIEGIAFVRLTKGDIVRHRLVQDIVEAYERDAAERGRGGPPS
ncbi:MAG TPA: PhoH family protein [Planctomycetota bacterium]|nr:PhoH family protein [Planctomycetota bacterium]HRR81944.1 PhoH family protein [Planctomycetota bacterium]